MINRFTGQYEFLSNFYHAPMIEPTTGLLIPTVEHGFQACKVQDDSAEIAAIILDLDTPTQAKMAGRQVTLRSDWEDIKVDVMRSMLELKFLQHPKLRLKLVRTHPHGLIEGNYWHDNFWGICTCFKCSTSNQRRSPSAMNHLGKLLREIRQDLLELTVYKNLIMR